MSRLREAQTRYFKACALVNAYGPSAEFWAELELAAAEYGAAEQEAALIQPCGHPRTAIVQGGEGTAYCGECERRAKRGA